MTRDIEIPHSRIRDRLIVIGVVVVVAVLGLTLTRYVADLLQQRAGEQQKSETLARLSGVRARLEGEVSATIYITQGLVSYAAINQGVTQKEFDRFAREMATSDRAIIAVALAPDNVVRYIHPLAGNERVIGLDYAKNEAQWPVVKRVMEERRTVVAGPVDLVQGGRGLIARSPILLPGADGETGRDRHYWGVASVVVDTDTLFDQAGIRREAGGYSFALRGVDGLGAAGDMIMGDPALFEDAAVTLPVNLPNGQWQLAGRPVDGWVHASSESRFAKLAGAGTTVIFAILSALLVHAQQRARAMALHDDLTGLPNRRLLVDRMEQLAALSERTGIGFQVFFIDLNGFKPINDTFGHAVGDMVLRSIGDRLREETRDSDTIARIGGDEFVVVVPGLILQRSSANIADRLRQSFEEPVRVGEHVIAIQVSVGWATYPEDATNISEILALADQRMYRDKETAA
ncbi:diguanylate cyclase [Stappia sp. ES.058]|uniref:diguanylate cyclase n=1 Tax=Stappia sp. ES.058 TaxID=1881061 RepID=UPI00087A450E|nr:diguanylate cyclase [Stappia sp. ES.058]SDU46725.1 diguanylate cyclase (GGDEF) domain-containing protein [Stappia sp. ES.058]